MDLLVFDIDGTLANNSHRMGFLQSTKKDWASFYNPELVSKDEPFPKAQDFFSLENVRMRSATNPCCYFFLSGRPEVLREVTTAWLAKHFNIYVNKDSLFLRPDGDYRKADIYKEEVVRSLIKELPGCPLVFFDDDERNVEMYAKYGTLRKAPECWG